ncbi:MAG: hypothetical protein EP330_11225 [Deltaproteobacteria bacterium]|nr:MAG: hypothetical protein EP330_11225 [Deltaproteobacteria bacterium]
MPAGAGFFANFTGSGIAEGTLAVLIGEDGKKLSGTYAGTLSGKAFSIPLTGNLNERILVLTGHAGKDKVQCNLELTETGAEGRCWGKITKGTVRTDIEATRTP